MCFQLENRLLGLARGYGRGRFFGRINKLTRKMARSADAADNEIINYRVNKSLTKRKVKNYDHS